MSLNDPQVDLSRNLRVSWEGCSVLLDINDDDRLVFARLSAASSTMSLNDPQVDLSRNLRVSWEGCSVLLDINDGDRLVFARLSAASTVKIGNKNYSLQPLVGCPFGSLFQIDNGSDGSCLSRLSAITKKEGYNSEKTGVWDSRDEVRDNRDLIDNNEAQNLTGEDIDSLRSQGATGDEIVEALINNSATFDKKTMFSQEKYRLKKQKKYAPRILMRRPFAKSICEAYFKKYPTRIGFLRVDALSLLLSLANVFANSDVLVVDMVGGLLTGAVAERLGGTGYVCSAYLGNSPCSIDIVRIFNFNDDISKRIVRSSLTDLSSSQVELSVQNGEDEVCGNNGSQLDDQVFNQSISGDIPRGPENGASNVNLESICTSMKAPKSVKAGDKAPPDVINSWKEDGFTSLIIAAPELDTWHLVKDALPLLATSAPFAIYHQYLQPLATCMHELQNSKMAIGMQISEPWLREYQVLPSRTHPMMQMSAFGGYILSGTKICSSSN